MNFKKIHKTLRVFFKGLAGGRQFKPALFFFFAIVGSAWMVFWLEAGSNDQFTNFFDGFWWTIVTFSSTGFGDKVPITIGGKIMAMVSIVIGICSIGFLSATFASLFIERNTRSRRGLMGYRRLKNHIVICGWKENMEEILSDILVADDNLAAGDLLIISNIPSERIEKLKSHASLTDLKFIRGDYFNENALKSAMIQEARKVMVLADVHDSKSATEVDPKTVMTVLTVKNIAKNVYTCVELLDDKYENYLKQIMCDEIIMVRNLSRHMLAFTTVTNGLFSIIENMLNSQKSGSRIHTFDVPGDYIGRTFIDFCDKFQVDERKVLGFLENTGSPHQIKVDALRDALKTADISALVQNLNGVKGIEINKPVFLPNRDYIIQRYSKAIVLERV